MPYQVEVAGNSSTLVIENVRPRINEHGESCYELDATLNNDFYIELRLYFTTNLRWDLITAKKIKNKEKSSLSNFWNIFEPSDPEIKKLSSSNIDTILYPFIVETRNRFAEIIDFFGLDFLICQTNKNYLPTTTTVRAITKKEAQAAFEQNKASLGLLKNFAANKKHVFKESYKLPQDIYAGLLVFQAINNQFTEQVSFLCQTLSKGLVETLPTVNLNIRQDDSLRSIDNFSKQLLNGDDRQLGFFPGDNNKNLRASRHFLIMMLGSNRTDSTLVCYWKVPVDPKFGGYYEVPLESSKKPHAKEIDNSSKLQQRYKIFRTECSANGVFAAPLQKHDTGINEKFYTIVTREVLPKNYHTDKTVMYNCLNNLLDWDLSSSLLRDKNEPKVNFWNKTLYQLGSIEQEYSYISTPYREIQPSFGAIQEFLRFLLLTRGEPTGKIDRFLGCYFDFVMQFDNKKIAQALKDPVAISEVTAIPEQNQTIHEDLAQEVDVTNKSDNLMEQPVITKPSGMEPSSVPQEEALSNQQNAKIVDESDKEELSANEDILPPNIDDGTDHAVKTRPPIETSEVQTSPIITEDVNTPVIAIPQPVDVTNKSDNLMQQPVITKPSTMEPSSVPQEEALSNQQNAKIVDESDKDESDKEELSANEDILPPNIDDGTDHAVKTRPPIETSEVQTSSIITEDVNTPVIAIPQPNEIQPNATPTTPVENSVEKNNDLKREVNVPDGQNSVTNNDPLPTPTKFDDKTAELIETDSHLENTVKESHEEENILTVNTDTKTSSINNYQTQPEEITSVQNQTDETKQNVNDNEEASPPNSFRNQLTTVFKLPINFTNARTFLTSDYIASLSQTGQISIYDAKTGAYKKTLVIKNGSRIQCNTYYHILISANNEHLLAISMQGQIDIFQLNGEEHYSLAGMCKPGDNSAKIVEMDGYFIAIDSTHLIPFKLDGKAGAAISLPKNLGTISQVKVTANRKNLIIAAEKTNGRFLHLMPKLPPKPTEYQNSFVFIKNNDNRELYNIDPQGNYEKIKIVDFNLFEQKINFLKNVNETKLLLSEEQIQEIITSKVGHNRTNPRTNKNSESETVTTISVLNLENHRCTNLLNLPHAIYSIDVSPDGHYLALGGASNKVYLLNFEENLQLHTLSIEDTATKGLSFSPDGQHLAISLYTQGFVLYQLDNLQKILSKTKLTNCGLGLLLGQQHLTLCTQEGVYHYSLPSSLFAQPVNNTLPTNQEPKVENNQQNSEAGDSNNEYGGHRQLLAPGSRPFNDTKPQTLLKKLIPDHSHNVTISEQTPLLAPLQIQSESLIKNQLQMSGTIGRQIKQSLERLDSGSSSWNPYYYKSKEKYNRIITALRSLDISEVNLANGLANKDSELYKAINMFRLLNFSCFTSNWRHSVTFDAVDKVMNEP